VSSNFSISTRRFCFCFLYIKEFRCCKFIHQIMDRLSVAVKLSTELITSLNSKRYQPSNILIHRPCTGPCEAQRRETVNKGNDFPLRLSPLHIFSIHFMFRDSSEFVRPNIQLNIILNDRKLNVTALHNGCVSAKRSRVTQRRISMA
jgi:hypothetical protein